MGSKIPFAHSKTEALKESLLKICSQLSPGSRLPTVRKISASLDVSTSTLDRVMVELEREGRIVRRHGSGVFVAEPKAATSIALVSGVDPFAVGQSPFYQIMGNRIRSVVGGKGLGFKFYLDPHFENHGMPSRREFLADLDNGNLLGAVFMATAHPAIFLSMNERGFPYVALSDCPDARHRFSIDSPSMVTLGVDQLAQAGCGRICLLTWDGFGSQVEQCHENFKKALRGNGLPLLAEAIWTRKERRPDDDVFPRQVFGAIAAKEFLGQGAMPFDGMVCTDDMLCSGALSAFSEHSLFPGGGLLVATHANKGSPVLALAEKGLIKLEVDTESLVSDVLSCLSDLLEGKDIEPFGKYAKVEVVKCAGL